MLTHRTEYRVIYADTDNMGFAYYANYLRWFEIGRTEMLRAWGLPYREIEAHGLMLPVAEAKCKYMTPARYDERLVIESTLDAEYKGGLKIDYRILSSDDRTLHATGHTRHAFMNRDGRVVRPPRMILDLIRKQADKTG